MVSKHSAGPMKSVLNALARITYHRYPSATECLQAWSDSLSAAVGEDTEPVEGLTFGGSHLMGDTVQGDVELDSGLMIKALEETGVWGWADEREHAIHLWIAPNVERGSVLHLVAHEIAHLVIRPWHPDPDIAEELLADYIGLIAKQAFEVTQECGSHWCDVR